jgi:DNA-binding XRE family transcriptional regulator
MIGYTLYMVRKNNAADSRKLGVQLGRICISKNIPVQEIAEIAGVSTQAVYKWFMGDYCPKPRIAQKIFAYLNK